MIAPIERRNVSQKLHHCKLFIHNGLCRVVEKVDLFYYNTHRKFILYICIYRVMENLLHFVHRFWLTPYKASG